MKVLFPTIFCGASLLVVTGCSSYSPSLFLAVYGSYENQISSAQRTVRETVRNEDIAVIQVAPPAGATKPLIIHGEDAKESAERLASALSNEFNEVVDVYSQSLGNHAYTEHHIGIYLIDDMAETASNEEILNSVEIIPSKEYLPVQCLSFDGVLELNNNGSFTVSGTSFTLTEDGQETELTGSFVSTPGGLTLKIQGNEYEYIEHQVGSSQPSVKVRKLVPRGASLRNKSIFGCGFIQDLRVISRSADSLP